MIATPDLLTPEELRKILGISEATYFRWLREGKLRGQRAGRNWRFSRAHAEQLLADGATGHDVRNDLSVAITTYGALLMAAGLDHGGVKIMTDEAKASKQGGAELAHMMLEHAAATRAAAIHLDQTASGLRVRERVDGALAAVTDPLPKGAGREVVQALRDMAGISNSEVAAEGRFAATVAGREVLVWASTYPSAAGESLTLKLLDAAQAVGGLAQFGFADDQLEQVRRLAHAPSGAIIVTGPHGCGKTSTAYALLHELHTDPQLKIMTAEDPLEFHLEGVQQAEVNGPNGLTHFTALQAMLQADLDVGMISEFRDQATLDLFFKAAHTGHLMIGVMHASEPILAIKVALEVGRVPAPLLGSSLLAVINQRLYRRSCPHCRTTKTIAAADAEALRLAGADRKMQASYNAGCGKCRSTGFLGRIMVADIFEPSERHRSLLGAGAILGQEAALVAESRASLRERLLAKVRTGDVSPTEAMVHRHD